MRLWIQFLLMILFPLGGGLLAGVLFRRRSRNQARIRTPLIIAILLNSVWSSGLAADFVGRSLRPDAIFWWQRIALYTLPIAAVAILYATVAFSHHQRPISPRWRYVLVAGLLVTLALDSSITPWQMPALSLAGRVITTTQWWQTAWLVLWCLPVFATLRIVFLNYPRKAGPFHRNRARYWALAVVVNVLGDLFALSQPALMVQAGALVKLLAATLATINLITLRLPDLRIILRRTTAILAVGTATFALFLIGMLGSQAVQLRPLSGDAIFWVTAGLALLMTFLFYPLQYVVHRLIENVIFRDIFDLDAVLRSYSEHISQLLELEPLAQRMVETVDEALHIRHGALALVKPLPDQMWRLEPVLTKQQPSLRPLMCQVDGPLVERLKNGLDPLAQYDIDVLPDFATLAAGERATLAEWDAELYVPIRARGQVTGVLVLGAKQSGDPYIDADFVLLRTLADQTAVALENARLFADLRALNREITLLNRSLEQANLELKELDKLKSSFIGMITHELRSPFVPLDLSLQLIEKHGLENMLPEQREEFVQMRQSIASLRRMVDDLISFASLVSKQKTLEMGKVQLGEVLQEATRPLSMMAKARRVSVSIDVAEPMPEITADRERLADAIHHLVHNAIKFNRPGGTATIRCRAEQNMAIVDVQDTGRGIPPDRVQSLGTPFMQLADPVKRGVEGIGLGLSLVKYIVQAHGGRLQVDSKLGVGSTFSIYLPMAGPAIQRPRG